MHEFFSRCIAAILHKENFVNIELFSLIREFETLPSHHNDSNKMKSKNKIDQNPPLKSFLFSFFLEVSRVFKSSVKCSHFRLVETFGLIKCPRCF